MSNLKKLPFDRTLFFITVSLVVFGFIAFSSAALGLLSREGAGFLSVTIKQFFIGIVLGSIFLFGCAMINYKTWRTYSVYIFLGSLILTALVFVPHIGSGHGGAQRWLNLGPLSVQPGEFLKIAFVILFAAFLSKMKTGSDTLYRGILPLGALSAMSGVVMLAQPDTDGFLIMIVAGMAMLFSAGGRIKYFVLIFLMGLIVASGLIYTRPYIKARFETFLHPTENTLGSGYQIRQSLIAIGSGGFTGRGFGQSLQKFQYLPEPVGDSIFAVISEELGFVGATILIILFTLLILRSLHIAGRAPDLFGQTLIVGIITIIGTQSFLNITSMLGLFPLSGTPLAFVSQGGTSLLVVLSSMGIILNVSRYKKG